jgi:guanylate kinase
MLILILGPSGAGKTTVIEELVSNYKWVPINSYITRPARAREMYKISISEAEYLRLRRAGELFSDLEQHGYCYGTSLQEITAALRDSVPHVLDFTYTRRQEVFGGREHTAIALLPETDAELVRRLEEAGREDRIDQALRDLLAINDMVSHSGSSEFAVVPVVNLRNQVAQAAAQIDALVKRFS